MCRDNLIDFKEILTFHTYAFILSYTLLRLRKTVGTPSNIIRKPRAIKSARALSRSRSRSWSWFRMHRVPIYVTYTWPTGAQFSFFTLPRARRVAYGIHVNSVYIRNRIEYITEKKDRKRTKRDEVRREGRRREVEVPISTSGKVYRVPLWHDEKGVESWTREEERCWRRQPLLYSASLVPSFSEKLRYIWFTVGIVRAFERPRDSDPRFSNRSSVVLWKRPFFFSLFLSPPVCLKFQFVAFRHAIILWLLVPPRVLVPVVILTRNPIMYPNIEICSSALSFIMSRVREERSLAIFCLQFKHLIF